MSSPSGDPVAVYPDPAVKAQVEALPPLTDEQLDAVCDTLAAIRLRIATEGER